MAPISVGTDCSGMEAPVQALQNLCVNFDHKFSCEIDKDARATITANFQPSGKLYEDITQRDNRGLYADIYVAGFPCQPFSMGGKQQGFEDQKGRGIIFFHVLDYLQKNKPKLFILENVKGLQSIHKGQYFDAIMEMLHRLRVYNVQHKVLNTKEHGIPHSRPRLYIIGIRKDVDTKEFEFPEAINCPSIEHFLDERDRKLAAEGAPRKTQCTATNNLRWVTRKLRQQGNNPERDPWIIDVDSSETRVGWKFGLSPCITARRCDGHWITNRGRRFNTAEMMRLQGMDPRRFVLATTENKLGVQLGNTMSVNVVERILVRALPAAKLIPRCKLVDRWANGTAVKKLSRSKGTILKRQQDDLEKTSAAKTKRQRTC